MGALEPLLLFSHKFEMDACVESIHAHTILNFESEIVGIGPRNAKKRTTHILQAADRPPLIIGLGTAGWLVPGKPPTTPIWVRDVRELRGPRLRPTLTVSNEVINNLGLRPCSLVTVNRPVVDVEWASSLASDLDVEIVDMESYAILEACVEQRVDCVVIRAVSDRANQEAFATYREKTPKAMRTLGQSVAQFLKWLQKPNRG